MQDVYVDVLVEIPTAQMVGWREPSRRLVEMLREGADRACEEKGARLRTDRPPEITVEHAQHRLTGEAVVLVASRWSVVAPDALTVAP